jgi:competence protein ComEA
MFGRKSFDDDATAAARRRLAALATQFSDADAGEVADQPGDPGKHMANRRRNERGRVALTPQQLVVMAAIAVAMVVIAGWWVLRSIPDSEPAPVVNRIDTPSAISEPTGGGPTGAADTSAGTTVTTGDASLVVDVAGKVRHPGLVELPSGSRVIDALDAAGGVRHGVDNTGLNLARLLVDGEQIVVGYDVPAQVVPPVSTADSSANAIASVNLNTATAEQLDTLPGIGPVTAQAILDWREENGAFTSVDELLEVSGIGDATLADIEAYVYV